ncbi:MAG: aspartate/glutamate racemase family protein [Rhodoferax sp.]|nr:aspartate/glutamate racemase family protein [Rhodoferax sp.]
MRTVVVVHTGPATVQPIKQQFQQILPDVRVVNIMDDSLLNDVMAAGHLTEAVTGRIFSYMQLGQQMGAVALLNACSSVGEAASAARPAISIPIIKIDDVMAERAVAAGPRIGVVATVRTTLEPTVRLIKAKAAAAGRSIEVTEALAEGGFQALLDGKPEEHDDIVKRTIQSLADKVDVIVLAQVSMARLIPSLTGLKVPVLSSPQSGVEAVRDALASLH